MPRSFPPILAAAIALSLIVASCATAPPEHLPLPAEIVRTATMNITPGIEVLTHLALPQGFVPSPGFAPMWLQAGKEVAIVGTRDGHTEVMGYGGIGYRTQRVIAEDGGVGAQGGSIVDLAASPDGMMLALAVADAKEPRLDIVVRDVISQGAANPVSSFDGQFEMASIGWLDNFTIPLALRARAQPPSTATTPEAGGKLLSVASSGLYVTSISGAVTTGYLKLDCKMSRLTWSPQGIVAVGSGDALAPPIIIDRSKESCQAVGARPPIRVIDWAHDSKSFLYEEVNGANGVGAYSYDLASKRSRLVAISSGAAAFVSNNQILALGNDALTFRGAQFKPEAPVRAEIAISNTDGSKTEVLSLGFVTTPAMLAASTMSYTSATDSAAIATFSPSSSGPTRKIVVYSVAPGRAFLVALGLARGVVTMSWSPRGRYLAIADGDVTSSALTIISPPR